MDGFVLGPLRNILLQRSITRRKNLFSSIFLSDFSDLGMMISRVYLICILGNHALQNFRFFGAHFNLFSIIFEENSTEIRVNRHRPVLQLASIELIFGGDITYGVINLSAKF